jgi:hypothetical protein
MKVNDKNGTLKAATASRNYTVFGVESQEEISLKI